MPLNFRLCAKLRLRIPAWPGVAPAVANDSQMLQPQNFDHLVQRVVELLVAYCEHFLVEVSLPR